MGKGAGGAEGLPCTLGLAGPHIKGEEAQARSRSFSAVLTAAATPTLSGLTSEFTVPRTISYAVACGVGRPCCLCTPSLWLFLCMPPLLLLDVPKPWRMSHVADNV